MYDKVLLASCICPPSAPPYPSQQFLISAEPNISVILVQRAVSSSGWLCMQGGIALSKFLSRRWLVLALIVLASGALILELPVRLSAQATGNGLMAGNWKLNVAKSNFGGGSRLMAMTIKVASDTPELIQFSVDQTTESGFAVSYSYKGAADGKDYPIVGSSSVYSYTEEPGIVHETQKDADGTVTKGDFTVSANGKVGTWIYSVTNPDGTVVKSRLIFDHSA